MSCWLPGFNSWERVKWFADPPIFQKEKKIENACFASKLYNSCIILIKSIEAVSQVHQNEHKTLLAFESATGRVATGADPSTVTPEPSAVTPLKYQTDQWYMKIIKKIQQGNAW